MKLLSSQEANEYLCPLSMHIGKWNQISHITGGRPHWARYHAPEKAKELYCFSEHVAGWLPQAEWKIFQINDSTSLSIDENYLFSRLAFGEKHFFDINKPQHSTLLFEFDDNKMKSQTTELLIAHLMYVLLLSESHADIISSRQDERKYVSIQDGFVYFISDNERDIKDAGLLIENFSKNPLALPKWVLDVNTDYQKALYKL